MWELLDEWLGEGVALQAGMLLSRKQAAPWKRHMRGEERVRL